MESILIISMVLFWLLFLSILYPYMIYPILLYLFPKKDRKHSQTLNELPLLSIIIPGFNEEDVIVEKIKNTLNLEYPPELLEIIVVSDASTDKTEELVAGYKKDGVILIVNKQRHGKTYGLNKACKIANGEILIFTDADAMIESKAPRLMIRSFTDSNVGLVTGSTRYYSKSSQGNIVQNMGLYTRFERWIKEKETQIFSCVGADGALFALKRDLYRPLRDDDINDFVIPLDVVRQRYKVVFDPQAFCLEEHTTDESNEFLRQIRIANRTIRALITHRDLLNPFNYGYFAWMLLSHKVLRFLVPWLTLLLIGINCLLLFSTALIYKISAVCVILFLVVLILFGSFENSTISLFKSFVNMNVAYLFAWGKVFKRQTIIVWDRDEKSK